MFRSSDSLEARGGAFVSSEKSPTCYAACLANCCSAASTNWFLYMPFVRSIMAFSQSKFGCRFGKQRMLLRSGCFLAALAVAFVAQTAQGQWQSKVPAQQSALKTRAAGHSSMMTVVSEGPGHGVQAKQRQPQIRQAGYAVAGETLSVKEQQAADRALSPKITNTTSPPFIDLSNEPLEPASAGIVEPTHTDMLIRLGTWTVIVMCLCGLTVLAIRRWQTKHGMLPVARGQSQIVETVILGANRSVSLVELRGVQALVGCDANGIQSIVPVPPAFADILEDGESGAALSQSSDTYTESTA
jgi:flagellar biogenesis protein FliO